MINVHLTRAEALLIVELVNKSRDSLVESLIIAVEEENDKETLAKTAKQNYVANLEKEVRRLEEKVQAMDEAKEIIAAPHGIKKDGTPKAKPGRKTIKRKTKGN